TMVPGGDFAPHLVACSDAAKNSAQGCIGLVGHHDTVFPPGSFEGFTLEGDIARGPGVLDMKGGLTVVLYALRAVAERGLLSRLPLRLVIVSDEEIGSPDSTPLLQRSLRGASAALVFEAGRAADAIITARKGTGGIRTIIAGKAAHAGNHHQQGANAIWALARIVDRVQRLTDYGQGITVNAGTITGGEARNTVPAHAEASFDLRFVHLSDGEALVERFRAAAALAITDVAGTQVQFEGGVKRPPLERSDNNVALYREYASHARAAGLGYGEAPLMGGGSDASTTAAMGVPSIDGLGPRGKGFHTHGEFIEVPTLLARAEALTRMLVARAAAHHAAV
ncbi:MAG TPA: M20 family peptidase, partial [Sorangium sp.]|nr:M20 family peptidase [Sorangium sp.]